MAVLRADPNAAIGYGASIVTPTTNDPSPELRKMQSTENVPVRFTGSIKAYNTASGITTTV